MVHGVNLPAPPEAGAWLIAKVSNRDLTKSYGTIEVLHGPSFDAADGEFVALIGPPGCGKSRLLRKTASW